LLFSLPSTGDQTSVAEVVSTNPLLLMEIWRMSVLDMCERSASLSMPATMELANVPFAVTFRCSANLSTSLPE